MLLARCGADELVVAQRAQFMLLARCGADELVVAQRAQPPEIGRERAHLFLAVEQVDAVAQRVEPGFARAAAEQRRRLDPFAGRGRNRGQGQLVTGFAPPYLQQARLTGAEGHALAAIPLQQDMPAGQGRMAA